LLLPSESSKLAAEAPKQHIKIETPEQGLELIICTRHRPRERGIISSDSDRVITAL
jgi:hypothetical protein